MMTIEIVREQYPQYADLSDAELTSALHRKFYSDMPLAEFSQKIGLVPPQPVKAPETASLTDQVLRQLGLTGRYAVEGGLGLANVFADPLAYTINKIAGTNAPLPSQGVSQALTDIGVPEPQGNLENTIGAFSRALPGVAGSAQLAKYGPEVIKRLGPAVVGPRQATTAAVGGSAPALAPLGENLAVQGQAALGAAGASDLAHRAGIGDVGQFVAGMTGGMLAPTAVAATRAAGRAGPALLRPFSEEGRDRIIGRELNKAAADPKAAIEALEKPPLYVAGSTPTAGQATGDYGLLGAERSVIRQPQSGPAYMQQMEANNAARWGELRQIAGPPDAIKLAEAARDAKALPILEQAFLKAKPVDTSSVEKLIYTLGNASKDKGLKGTLGEIMDAISGETNPHGVYEVRKLIDQKLDVNIPENRALAKYGQKSLMAVKNQIDVVLNKATRNQFEKYIETYKDMSKYVDRAKAGKEIVDRFANTQLDTQGNPLLTPHALKSVVGNIENPVTGKGAADIFSVGQMDAINRVIADLDRASRSNLKPAGSDTYQNLASGHALGQILGPRGGENTLAQITMRRGLDLLYRPVEEKLQARRGEAHLNPPLAAQLMKNPASQYQPLDFKKWLEGLTYGGLLNQ